MSGNWFDIETPSTHFRRFLSRWTKKIRGRKLTIDDISVVQVRDRHGTSYEARRSIDGGWTVYRIYNTAYGKEKRASYEKVRDLETLEEALGILNGICPVTHVKNSGEYNHPVQIARLLPPVPA
jgi:hypothetical protein